MTFQSMVMLTVVKVNISHLFIVTLKIQLAPVDRIAVNLSVLLRKSKTSIMLTTIRSTGAE